MIIDKDGIINIPNLGIVISPKFTVDDLKNNKNIDHILYSGSNSGYDRYGIKDMLIDGLPFGAWCIFYQGTITQIFLSYIGYYTSKIYEEITPEQRELAKKQHDKLLLEQYGATKTKCLWGSLHSDIDKGGEPRIFITYNNSPIKGRV